MGFNKTKALILLRLIDVESQSDDTMLPALYISLKKWPIYVAVPYMSDITYEIYRWAFSRAHFDIVNQDCLISHLLLFICMPYI